MTPSSLQMLKLWVGRSAYWITPTGIKVAVRITDAKQSYGKLRARIAPLAGTGTAWVELPNIEFRSAVKSGLTRSKAQAT